MNSLRQLIKSKGTVWAAGAFDALSARLVQEAGFDALLTSGYAISSTLLGEPDTEQYTMTENAAVVRNVCNAVTIPVIADIDTGYGNAVSAMRTMREFENAGCRVKAEPIRMGLDTGDERCVRNVGIQAENGFLLAAQPVAIPVQVAGENMRRDLRKRCSDPEFVHQQGAAILPRDPHAVEIEVGPVDGGVRCRRSSGRRTRRAPPRSWPTGLLPWAIAGRNWCSSGRTSTLRNSLPNSTVAC